MIKYDKLKSWKTTSPNMTWPNRALTVPNALLKQEVHVHLGRKWQEKREYGNKTSPYMSQFPQSIRAL